VPNLVAWTHVLAGRIAWCCPTPMPPRHGAKARRTATSSSLDSSTSSPGARVVQAVDCDSEDPSHAGTMTMTWEVTKSTGQTRVDIIANNVPDGIAANDHAAGLASSLANLAKSRGIGPRERPPCAYLDPRSGADRVRWPVGGSASGRWSGSGPPVSLRARCSGSPWLPLGQRPPVKLCVRFSRTGLSDIVHREACAVS
jgi:Activator of Hsp90 ATPase homolog 1-like protein